MKGMISEQLTLGRMEILTDAEYIDESNLLEELDRALVPHRVNRSNIQYLWNYYRGFQDIQYKEKLVRPEINHKVTVNKASQIVKLSGGQLYVIEKSVSRSLMLHGPVKNP